jgi:hypothetical protein
MQTLSYNPVHVNTHGLGSSPFARRYYGNRKNLLPEHNGIMYCYIIVSFRKKVPYIAFFSWRYWDVSLPSVRICLTTDYCSATVEFPHSDISGYNGWLAPYQNISQPFHVLHRFLKPRHPPYTLSFLQGMLYTKMEYAFPTIMCSVHRCTMYFLSVLERHLLLSRLCVFCCVQGTKRPCDDFHKI